jgi:alkanesulfonate monooxygenase SsuD/methylene tetrahydromethanopterin reductase-like flavin-dependent oxidoreductase (luciferase family)
MKVSLFASPSYLNKDIPQGWPVAPKLWDPALGAESMDRAFDVYDTAHDLGFDWLAVAEHHYFSSLLGPNPMLVASVLARRYDDIKIAVLGAVLPQVNPIRVAEELATIDALSNGRLVAGVFRGLPNEYLAYGTNPREARAMFDEAFELILRAWTEPEPFWWEGRYYRFPIVSVWPRPVQQPRPPIVSSGTSPESAAFAGRNGLKLGLSLVVPPDRCAELVEIYRGAAAEAGWEPEREDVLYRGRVYVAETDAQAERDCRDYELGDFLGPLAPPPERLAAQKRIMEAMGGPPRKGGGGPPGKGTMPEYWGNPDTVARAILESSERIGYGVLDYAFDAFHLPHEKAMRSLELFGREVLPALRTSSP